MSDEPFAHDVQRRVPSTEKAKLALGFEATTSLDEMLDEVIPWIEKAILSEGQVLDRPRPWVEARLARAQGSPSLPRASAVRQLLGLWA